MIGALLYWRALSLRNHAVAAVKRLRQPKYLVSSLAGALYFYFIFLRRLHYTAPASYAGRGGSVIWFAAMPVLLAQLGAVILLALLFVYAVLAWISAVPEARLKFSEAEVAFLFPAPLSRTRLIHFNLLSRQFTILITSIILSVVLNRWSFLGGNALTHAIGWWLILSTVSLFESAMNFTASRAVERFGPRVKGRALGLLALLAFVAGRALWRTAQDPGTLDARTLPAYVSHWTDAAWGRFTLKPFEWVIAPFAAASLRTFLFAVPLALVLPLICYAVVLRLQVPFREGSLAAAGKRAQVRAARRTGGGTTTRVTFKARRAPFALPAQGRPELAFLWKNLIGIQSWFNLRIVVSLVVFASVMMVNLSRMHVGGSSRAAAPVVLIVAVIVGFYIMLLGPQLIRWDLRSDLLNADLLKVYPLRGWQIVGGQMLTSAVFLSLLLWLAALAAGWAVLSGAGPQSTLTFGSRITALLCVGVLIPPVVLLQLVIPNAAALLLPAWHQNSRSRGGGIEAIGQRLIFTFGQFLAVVIALIPAVILAALIALATIWLVGYSLGFVLATVAIAVVVGGEVWIGLWWLGRRFERLDIAMELKP